MYLSIGFLFSTDEYISADVVKDSESIPLEFFLKSERLDSSKIILKISQIVECIRTSNMKAKQTEDKQKVC